MKSYRQLMGAKRGVITPPQEGDPSFIIKSQAVDPKYIYVQTLSGLSRLYFYLHKHVDINM